MKILEIPNFSRYELHVNDAGHPVKVTNKTSGRVLAIRLVDNCRLVVGLTSDEGKSDKYDLGAIALAAFTGLPRPAGLCVMHVDGNSLNNSRINLLWGTKAANNAGPKRARRSLTRAELERIAELLERVTTQAEIIRRFSTTKAHTSRIANGICHAEITAPVRARVRAEMAREAALLAVPEAMAA